MMKVVIKIGGSLLFQKECEFKIDFLEALSKEILSLDLQKYQLGIVVGGGKIARKYIAAARQLGASETFCDELGIMITRQNARLLISALGDAVYSQPPHTLEDAMKGIEAGKIIVMGGLKPGQSTNAVAASLADRMTAKVLINATDVEGVYSEDPKINPNATKFDKITPEQLKSLVKDERKAGKYPLFDRVALSIISRSKIPTIIISGMDPQNIIKVLRGSSLGTEIIFP